MFDPNSFITNTPNAKFCVRMANERTDFIGSDVAPPVYTDVSQYSWYQYDFSNLRIENVKKDSKSEADKIEYNASKKSGQTVLRKLGGEIDPRDERDADAAVNDFTPTTASTIMEKLLLAYEQEVATAYGTSANYPSGLVTTLAAGNTFGDPGGADPVTTHKDLNLAIRLSSGKVPNAVLMSWEVLQAYRVHPALLDRIKYTTTELSADQVAALLGYEKLFVGKAVYNNSKEGQADALAPIWGKFVCPFFWNPSQDKKQMAHIRTFIRNQIYEFADVDKRRGSGDGRIKTLEMGWEYDLKGVAQDVNSKFVAGGLIANAIP